VAHKLSVSDVLSMISVYDIFVP